MNIKKLHIFIFLSLFISLLISNNSFASISEIDNLKIQTQSISNDSLSSLYFQIAKVFKWSSSDSALKYANKSLQEALKINNQNQAISSLIFIAALKNSVGKKNESLRLFNEAKKLSISESNYEELANTYLELSRYYNSKYNYSAALGVLDSAMTIINNHKLTHLKPVVLNLIGYLYLNINDIPTALYYANSASNLLADNNDTIFTIQNLHLKSTIALRESRLNSSLDYLTKALTISKKIKLNKLIQQSYKQLAAYYIDISKYNVANSYIDSSLAICKIDNSKIVQSILITFKAHISWLLKDFKKALEYNKEALEIRKMTGHQITICSSILNIGGNYTELHQYKKARHYLDSGLAIAKDQKIMSFIAVAYDKLSSLNSLEGNYKEALHNFELKTKYKDSVLLKSTDEKIILLNRLYELEKEKRSIESLKLKKKSNEVLFLIISTLLAIGIIILLFWINIVQKRSTNEIVKLSKIVETTDQAVIITDEKGKLIYANNGLLKMTGYNNIKELINFSIFQFTDKNGKSFIINTIFPQLQQNGNWSGEMKLLNKNGTEIIVEQASSIIKGQKGNPDLFVAIFNNITDRKKSEIELQNSRESLKRTVETQDRMFSIIAHDLISPFSTILGYSEIMATDYDKYKKADHIKFCKVINESSKNTYDLLTNLLDWSRSHMGSIELNTQTNNFYNIVEENVELLKIMIANKEILFINNVEKDSSIYADRSTMSIVIRNLLSNAIKFTPRKGKITISYKNQSSNTIIEITDTGIGIKPEEQEKLFSISNNSSHPGTENEKGTGLGLTLCSELMELNKGSISIKSIVNKGSTFILTLPKNTSS